MIPQQPAAPATGLYQIGSENSLYRA